MTHTISKEFQQTITEKIEFAFNNGTGDYFMQKNNFSDIIAVSEYSIKECELKGYESFILNYYNKAKNIVTINNDQVKNEYKKRTPLSYGHYDEFPDAYNQNL